MTDRTCTKCGEAKPLTEYHRDKRSPGGFRRQCKACRCAQTMDWWYANQERQLQRHREYVDANRDRVREIDNRRYRENYDARVDLAMAVTHAKRAREAGAEYDTTVTRSALRERDGDRCHYCGVVMDFSRTTRKMARDKATVDHVVPISAGGGHTFDNTVLACWGCNADKRNEDAESFRERTERRSAGDTPRSAGLARSQYRAV